MTALPIAITPSPLDAWIAARLGVPRLTRQALEQYQLDRLRQTLHTVRERSPFYARHLRNVNPEAIGSLRELRHLPFTTPNDLMEHGGQMLCVSQSEVARVVTMESSGTSGRRKRMFFSACDQENAMDFFAHGVLALAGPGDRMLIALPSERHGSVGKLLAAGIARAGVEPVPLGIMGDPAEALAVMDHRAVTCAIGFPVQMLQLCSQRGPLARHALSRLRSLVLCSDHVPQTLVDRIQSLVPQCEIYEHYGMTEMCLGGGVDCGAHEGYHLREADLLFEIIDPASGEPVPEGQSGEVVFTTLLPGAMPLVRYRTGDISSFSLWSCPCGSQMHTLRRIAGRVHQSVYAASEVWLTMPQLEDALFAVDGLLDFRAQVRYGLPSELQLQCMAEGCVRHSMSAEVRRALESLPGVARAIAQGTLRASIECSMERFAFQGAKRLIEESVL